MERIGTHSSWKNWWLKKLWTSIALVWLLLTQNPQEAHAQDVTTQQIPEEILNNDSTITGDFTPELIGKIWRWVWKTFFPYPEVLKRDSDGKEYVCINWNNYYNIYSLFWEEFSWLWYWWLWNYSSTPNSFFIGTFKDGKIWGNWILIQANWDSYTWWFDDELYEGYWILDSSDWKHYEWNFHEWKMEWHWNLSWKNWDYYEWEFKEGKRHWEWNMVWKSREKYSWTWWNDNPVKDPRENHNPVVVGKWTYTYYWNDQVTYEVSKWERPNFISVQDKKDKENWDSKRGTIVYIVKNRDWKKSYELHSWNRDISYKEDNNFFVFSTQDWAELKFHINIWEKKAKAIANLINSVMSMVKNNDKWYSFYAFDYLGDTLQAQYRNAFFDTNLVKDIPWKIWISAQEFSDWLNHYRNDKPEWQLGY